MEWFGRSKWDNLDDVEPDEWWVSGLNPDKPSRPDAQLSHSHAVVRLSGLSRYFRPTFYIEKMPD
jgi:hypothetical protein